MMNVGPQSPIVSIAPPPHPRHSQSDSVLEDEYGPLCEPGPFVRIRTVCANPDPLCEYGPPTEPRP